MSWSRRTIHFDRIRFVSVAKCVFFLVKYGPVIRPYRLSGQDDASGFIDARTPHAFTKTPDLT